MAAPDSHAGDAGPADVHIGKIPVRNLWLLMLYASDIYRTAGSGRTQLEENPDALPDLVARILVDAVSLRQRRRLSAGYVPRSAVLNRVRGRIDVLRTERHQLLERGLVACRFEELSVDTPRNRYVCAALVVIGKIVRRADLAQQCRTLANTLRQQGVSGVLPTRAQLSADRYGRHDAHDRLMVDAAKLAFSLALPTEEAGTHALPLPDREGTWVRRLFERAVGGFYAVNLRPVGWRVKQGKSFSWQLSEASERARKILPGMVADIVLDDPERRHRIVIDTKFTSVVTTGWYREETVRNGYLYQIYSYLRSQTGGADALADSASGLLLHPCIGDPINETVRIQGHMIRFATVDLSGPSAAIRRQLLDVCDFSQIEE